MIKIFLLVFFVGTLFSQVTGTFDLSISKDVKRHDLFWSQVYGAGNNRYPIAMPDNKFYLSSDLFVDGTEYFFFIIAVDSSGNESEPSNIASIVFHDETPAGVKPPLHGKTVMMIWPNPNTGVVFNIESGVEVEISNILSGIIGRFKNQWNTNGYASGIYCAREIVGLSYGRVEKITLLK